MSKTSQTGNAKNVANFQNLISFCAGYGAAYNPSRDGLQVTNLQTLLSAAQAALAGCQTKETAFNNATHARHDCFAPLKPLATRIVNALAVSGVAHSVVEDAKSINHKIQGKRATTPKPVTTTPQDGTTAAEPATISASQQGFDNLVEHFNALIELVSSHTEYNPNEDDLKVTALQTLLAQLKSADTDVINTHTDWSNSRLDRDAILYAHTTGLVDTAIDVKAYIKSIFGATSAQYKQISGIEFKNK